MPRTLPGLVGALALWAGAIPAARADALRSSREQPLYEVAHTVGIRITDGVAIYKVRRQFANPGSVADEANLEIDLPAGGAATGLRIRARDRWYDGELLEREVAARRYEKLTGFGAAAPKDPALLQWMWADKLHLQIFPVFPGQVSTVEYTLTVPTRYANGHYWVSYPHVDRTADDAKKLATPTITVTPSWGDATTAVLVDGHRVAPLTPIVLVPPVRPPWLDDISPEPGASYAASAIDIPSTVETRGTAATAKVTLDVSHTFRGDLELQLLTPNGKLVTFHERSNGGTANDLHGTRDVTLPADTPIAGTWRLVAGDHAARDTGSIDRWDITFASSQRLPLAFSAKDTPVFIPDAPEGTSDAGVAAIAVAPPNITTWSARLGRIVASDRHAFGRLEVDVAPALSKVPARAQVVFVVDTSYSAGADKVAAQLDILRAYAAHVPDADFAVVTYNRRAKTAFTGFTQASVLERNLEYAVERNDFALGNGSALDAGAELAAKLLANRAGPRRVVLLTDELVRSTLTPDRALATMSALSKDTIVHVVIPHDGGRMVLERDDDHALAPLATKHRGILARVHGSAQTPKQLAPIVLELVRPTRIEGLAVTGGFEPSTTTLHEGDGLRIMRGDKTAPEHVTITGKLWSDPVRVEIAATPGMSNATAAFVFGLDEHHDLSESEMMTVALAGRAVSPVTSYLAIEPGTRPSTIGFGRGHLRGRTAMAPTVMIGQPNVTGGPRDIAKLVNTNACVASIQPATAWHVELVVETTKTEIVDVRTGTPSPLASCFAEVVWSLRLDGSHTARRREHRIALAGPAYGKPTPHIQVPPPVPPPTPPGGVAPVAVTRPEPPPTITPDLPPAITPMDKALRRLPRPRRSAP